jgi:hypothetical protein
MPPPTTAYLDEIGRPRLRESITAFLDVLGFSHTVVTAADTGQSQSCLDSIVSALNDARTFVRSSMSEDELDPTRWALKFFSDNLVVGYPCDLPTSRATGALFVLRCVQRYQLQMALSGFFARGAITLGPLCITDEIIFGSALIESYQLEAKASIVPRVIVTNPVLKAVVEHIRSADCQHMPDESDLLCRDIDGWWFVNYLQAALEPTGINWKQIDQHRASVLTTLAHSPRHDILPKFGWVSRYHNVFCHWHRHTPGYSDQYRIKRVDEESAIERLSNASLD